MKLIDLIKSINIVDEDLIIFLENIKNFESDIILEYPEDGDLGAKIKDGIKYHYLIEVYLAKEFVEDWLNSISYIPTNLETAKRLYEYALNDA